MKQTELLLEILKERYALINKIRDRVSKITFSVTGLIIAITGYLITAEKLDIETGNLALYGSLFLIFVVSLFFLFRDQEIKFKREKAVVIKLEQALGLYKVSAFKGLKGSSVYPTKWADVRPSSRTKTYFVSSYLIIFFSFCGLFVALLLNLSIIQHIVSKLLTF